MIQKVEHKIFEIGKGFYLIKNILKSKSFPQKEMLILALLYCYEYLKIFEVKVEKEGL